MSFLRYALIACAALADQEDPGTEFAMSPLFSCTDRQTDTDPVCLTLLHNG